MKLPRVLLPLLALWLAGASAISAQTSRNVVNDRFATVSSGLQSALTVDVASGAKQSQIDDAVTRKLKTLWKASSRAVTPATGRAKTRSVGGKRDFYPMSTVVAVRQNGKLVLKAPTRAVGNGTLNFVFSGFNGAQVLSNNGNPVVVEEFLRTLLLGDGQREGLYNKIVRLYGQPAWSGTVEVKSLGFFEDAQATDPQRQLFGAYDVSNNRILLPLYSSIDSTAHAFLLNVLHAFHGPSVFAYDAWEQGFIRAAATVIARDSQLGFLDPTANFWFTLLPRYDVLNQPALSGPRFVPASQENIGIDGKFTVGKMIFARMAMSGAAFLKCYIENPDFFKNFNAAYYAQLDPSAPNNLAGNIPALKNIARSVLPSVEGLAFDDWYGRQFVLDTSITPGEKLFAFLFPEVTDSAGRQSATAVLVYFRTTYDSATGRDDEILLGGRAYAVYTDPLGQRFPTGGSGGDAAQIEEGEGALTATFTVGEGNEIGRLTMDFGVGAQTVRTYLPFGLTGDVQAVGLGVSLGGVSASQGTVLPAGNSRTASTTFANKSFAVNFAGPSEELYQSQYVINDGGIVRTVRKNLGDGPSLIVLPAPEGAIKTVTRLFDPNPNALPHLLSFPVRPTVSAVDQAFNLPSDVFLLSGFDGSKGAYQTLNASQPTAPALAPGTGYWFKYAPGVGSGSVRLTLTGAAPATDTDFAISGRFGWNLIGSPFESPVAVSTILVKLQDRDPLTWDEAVAANLVLADVYGFDPATGYVKADSLDGANWKGYWIRVLAPTGVTLLLPGPDAGRAVKLTRSAATVNPGWSVRLTARQSGNLPFGGVARAELGGRTRAVERQSPPDIVPALALSLGDSVSLTGGGRRVGEFKTAAQSRRATWTVNVTSPISGPVRLGWEGLGGVPRGSRLSLIDGATKVVLSRTSGYTVDVQAGVTRSLKLIAEPAATSSLRIVTLNASTRAAGGGGVSVRYALSQEAEVTAEVSTLSGRTVRALGGGRATANRETSLSWDGKATGGAPLPAGSYLLTLTARSDDGETVRLTRPVAVLR